MIQYNYSDENYQAGVKGLKKAAEKGIPVMIMEPLLGGILADRLPHEAVKAFEDAASGVSPAAWAFRWLWDQPEVTVVLSGMNKMEQLAENIGTAEKSYPNMLTEEEHEVYGKVKAIYEKSLKIKCTGCNYCMPCPQAVNIPACFTAYNTYYGISRSMGTHQYLMSTGAVGPVQRYASKCNKCGKCEKICPQGIEVIKSLEDGKKTMEPFWFKPVYAIARKILGTNKMRQ
jgi:predicted aldo/keto reductase-like oxidoreductase